MAPFDPEGKPQLSGTSVFIGAGRADPIARPAEAERLAAMLRDSGADVTLHWETGGHSLTRAELDMAREWISRCLTNAKA
jgi:predicted esterase